MFLHERNQQHAKRECGSTLSDADHRIFIYHIPACDRLRILSGLELMILPLSQKVTTY